MNSTAEIAQQAAAEAIWSPSVHNTQPWRFGVDGQHIRVYADVGRLLTVADPYGREMLISCGAAVLTTRLALRSLGMLATVQTLPDPAIPELIADVAWRPFAEPTDYERLLAARVRLRRSHRGGFDTEPLPRGLLMAVRQCAARDGATLRVVADDGRRALLAAATQTAERTARSDGAFVRELARWSPAPGSAYHDGVPATSYAAQDDHTTPYFPSRDFAHGRGWGLPRLSPARLVRTTGVVALLTTDRDGPADWVNVGQALQRILLTTAAYGAAVALHSQPLELPWLRETLRTRLSDGAYPQLVLRFGMVTQMAASVRRDPSEVLFELHP
jgi:hypothetical protein